MLKPDTDSDTLTHRPRNTITGIFSESIINGSVLRTATDKRAVTIEEYNIYVSSQFLDPRTNLKLYKYIQTDSEDVWSQKYDKTPHW